MTEPTPKERLSHYQRAQWAARLMDVSVRHVYRMAERGELPGVRRFGRAIRIHRPTFLAWLKDPAA